MEDPKQSMCIDCGTPGIYMAAEWEYRGIKDGEPVELIDKKTYDALIKTLGEDKGAFLLKNELERCHKLVDSPREKTRDWARSRIEVLQVAAVTASSPLVAPTPPWTGKGYI